MTVKVGNKHHIAHAQWENVLCEAFHVVDMLKYMYVQISCMNVCM